MAPGRLRVHVFYCLLFFVVASSGGGCCRNPFSGLSLLLPCPQGEFLTLKQLILAFLVLPAAMVVGVNAEGILVLSAFEQLTLDKSSWEVHRGMVVDAVTHRPIVGAIVESQSGVPLQFVLDRDKTRTDEHGVYVVRTHPDRGSDIFVRAKGYRARGFWNTLDEPVRMVRLP